MIFSEAIKRTKGVVLSKVLLSWVTARTATHFFRARGLGRFVFHQNESIVTQEGDNVVDFGLKV
jgi:hypothetical protein